MYRINVKEQFDERFMIKAPAIFSGQAFNMFQKRSVLDSTYLFPNTSYVLIFSDSF